MKNRRDDLAALQTALLGEFGFGNIVADGILAWGEEVGENEWEASGDGPLLVLPPKQPHIAIQLDYLVALFAVVEADAVVVLKTAHAFVLNAQVLFPTRLLPYVHLAHLVVLRAGKPQLFCPLQFLPLAKVRFVLLIRRRKSILHLFDERFVFAQLSRTIQKGLHGGKETFIV